MFVHFLLQFVLKNLPGCLIWWRVLLLNSKRSLINKGFPLLLSFPQINPIPKIKPINRSNGGCRGTKRVIDWLIRELRVPRRERKFDAARWYRFGEWSLTIQRSPCYFSPKLEAACASDNCSSGGRGITDSRLLIFKSLYGYVIRSRLS